MRKITIQKYFRPSLGKIVNHDGYTRKVGNLEEKPKYSNPNTLPVKDLWEMRKKGSATGDMSPKREPSTMARIESGMRSGRLDPIEIDKSELDSGVIHEGKHRLIVAKKLGIKDYPVTIKQDYEKIREQIIKNKEKEIEPFINRINQYAMTPIDFDRVKKESNIDWLSRRVKEHSDKDVWNNLSTDRTSQKYFKTEPLDPTEGIFFVNTEYLRSHAGNDTDIDDHSVSKDKVLRIRDAVKNDIKLGVPTIWLGDKSLGYVNVGEGNHRIRVMDELGMKSVPVHILWD